MSQYEHCAPYKLHVRSMYKQVQAGRADIRISQQDRIQLVRKANSMISCFVAQSGRDTAAVPMSRALTACC